MNDREMDCGWGLVIGGLVLVVVLLGCVLGHGTQQERQNAIDRIDTHGRGATHWSGGTWTP